jgi:hypothetical protein
MASAIRFGGGVRAKPRAPLNANVGLTMDDQNWKI